MTSVALYTSAWIEIPVCKPPIDIFFVALYTSAWIEIIITDSSHTSFVSRTLHECVD